MQERGLLFLYASARLFFFRIVRRPRQKAEAFRRGFFVSQEKDNYLTEQEMTGGSYENTGIGDRTTFFDAFI